MAVIATIRIIFITLIILMIIFWVINLLFDYHAWKKIYSKDNEYLTEPIPRKTIKQMYSVNPDRWDLKNVGQYKVLYYLIPKNFPKIPDTERSYMRRVAFYSSSSYAKNPYTEYLINLSFRDFKWLQKAKKQYDKQEKERELEQKSISHQENTVNILKNCQKDIDSLKAESRRQIVDSQHQMRVITDRIKNNEVESIVIEDLDEIQIETVEEHMKAYNALTFEQKIAKTISNTDII